MTATALQVEDIGKEYQIGQREAYYSLRDVIMKKLKKPFTTTEVRGNTRSRSQSQTIWALQNVSFDVQQGDVIGVIGGNGAGKSTLLKILSRITAPTTGRVKVTGRVGSLLEVGTGFHPELTGRENIYLNGAILGMKRTEIRSKFDEIVSFAEIDRFLDTPVKRYSSGMYVRLAFAVAAHLEPEVLLVDEVLAVGDVAFQKKCLGKMEAVGKEGRTVLFVSHNMAAVEKLCKKSVVLDKGRVAFIGSQKEGIAHYLKATETTSNLLDDSLRRVGTGEIQLRAIEICNMTGQRLEAVTSGQNIEFRFYFKTLPNVELNKVLMAFKVKTALEVPVFVQYSRLAGVDFGTINGEGFFRCQINHLPLPPGNYRLDYSIMPNMGIDGSYYDRIEDATSLTVVDGDYYGVGEVPASTYGVCLVDADWDIQLGSTAT